MKQNVIGTSSGRSWRCEPGEATPFLAAAFLNDGAPQHEIVGNSVPAFRYCVVESLTEPRGHEMVRRVLSS